MEHASVHAVCVGSETGKAKKPAPELTLLVGYGAVGDAHAGPGPRQVSMLAQESVEELKKGGIVAQPGDFAENVTTRGLVLSSLPVGARLQLGAAVVEITEHGKKEWQEGDYCFQGVALVAKEGVFARVIESGEVRPGDNVVIA